jgi:hypothetical protein
MLIKRAEFSRKVTSKKPSTPPAASAMTGSSAAIAAR